MAPARLIFARVLTLARHSIMAYKARLLPPPHARFRLRSAQYRLALLLLAGAIIQLPWAMVVMQPWLRERRLSVGAAARGQYYLSDVNYGAPPPLGPHFPRPIPQSALSRP